MEETITFLNKQILKGGYVLEIEYDFKCNNWGTLPPDPFPIDIIIKMTSKDTEITYNSEDIV